MILHTAGESHGACLLAILSDVPAGVAVDVCALDGELARRRAGAGRSERMELESDTVTLLSGVKDGHSTGSPLALLIENHIAPSPAEPTTVPRPGHADLPGAQKIGTTDLGLISERASARETAARVAAGAIAKSLLTRLGVSIHSQPTEADPEAIDAAREVADTLGGTVTLTADGLVPGLGSYAERRKGLDAQLAAALMSIPSVKAVGIGAGFAFAQMNGSQAQDPIIPDPHSGHLTRSSNHAGGIEGGMSNGQQLHLTLAVKPVPTLGKALPSVDLSGGQPALAPTPRHDTSVVTAVGTVAEAEIALTLTQAYQHKFGGDSLSDLLAALKHYQKRLTLSSLRGA